MANLMQSIEFIPYAGFIGGTIIGLSAHCHVDWLFCIRTESVIFGLAMATGVIATKMFSVRTAS